jgi:hypothetical protein
MNRKMEDINLIRKVAWSFHETTGLEWNELFQEAALAYLEAKGNYDPKRGKLSTYVWNCIVSRLRTYLKKEQEYHCPLCDIDEVLNNGITYNFFWQYLPKELYDKVDIIMEYSNLLDSYFLENPMHSKERKEEEKLQAKITIRHLLRQAGYDRQDICGTIHELEILVPKF